MDLSTLSNTAGAWHRRKRVGRGMASGHGKTSGRGHKGQMAHKGHKHKLAFEGGQMPLLRRLPKRGFKNPNRALVQVINVSDLKGFQAGTEVGVVELALAGLVRAADQAVKVLGKGELSCKLVVKASAFSAAAKAKIEAAGGTCETV